MGDIDPCKNLNGPTPENRRAPECCGAVHFVQVFPGPKKKSNS